MKATSLIAADTITAAERATIIDERDWQAKLQQNRQQGIELGDTRGRKAVARSMLPEGLNMATIARLTGLSEAEILQLQSE